MKHTVSAAMPFVYRENRRIIETDAPNDSRSLAVMTHKSQRERQC